MTDEYVFRPPRRYGLAFTLTMVILLMGIGFLGLWQASRAQASLIFLFYLIPTLMAVLIIPVLLYRLYALWGAIYTVERDGIRLRWGLRVEDISIDSILWVGLEEQLNYPLAKPIIRLPGSVVGMRHLPDGKPLEFLAARARHLVVVITSKQAYAISPNDQKKFLAAFHQMAEFGSLTPLQARSVYPALLLATSWSDWQARALLIGGGILCLGLLTWVILRVPDYPQISFRPSSSGSSTDLVPGVRLLLLPVLDILYFIIDAILGLFFYRRTETRPLAYLMWGSSFVVSLFFIRAVYIIFQAA